MSEDRPRYGAGWVSDLPTFHGTAPRVVQLRLGAFVRDAGDAQQRAWEHWIPSLQTEAGALLAVDPDARTYTAILEYELPRDARRPDVLILEAGIVVVLELKGRPSATRAGLDQVLAYARDLRAYHADCHARPVIPVLVTASANANAERRDGAFVVAPRGLHRLLAAIARDHATAAPPLDPTAFLRDDAYEPLPSIVTAARRLLTTGDLPFVRRARACTDPALAAITAIAREAAATRTRHLVLLTGVPGSGKTLVGLQLAHAHWLDDLAVARANGKPTAPAVFLSGNGPLVAVLQDALKSSGGGGRTFVQDVKKYVATYSKRADRIPPEHLIVFDEAQRAHDAERVAHVHKGPVGASEPELLLRFLQRVPDWCVLVALVGTGQAIHQGEEGGLALWRDAVAASDGPPWTVHAAATAEAAFTQPSPSSTAASAPIRTRWTPALNLDVEIRHHLVPKVHAFVEALLDRGDAAAARRLHGELHDGGFRLLLADDLDDARAYLRERYGEAPLSRYGLIASSKDKLLPDHGVDNTFPTTKRLRVGPWFNAAPTDRASCCRLDEVATEFVVQGLELDMALLAWGSDLLRVDDAWSIARSRGTRGRLHDPLAIRRNVYRVLLTRGRDGTVVWLPPDEAFATTRAFLREAGFRGLREAGAGLP